MSESTWSPYSFPSGPERPCSDPAHADHESRKKHIQVIEAKLVDSEQKLTLAKRELEIAKGHIQSMIGLNKALQTSIDSLNTALTEVNKLKGNTGKVGNEIDEDERKRRISLSRLDRGSEEFGREWKGYQPFVEKCAAEFKLVTQLQFPIPAPFVIPPSQVAPHLTNQIGIISGTPTGQHLHAFVLGTDISYPSVVRLLSSLALSTDRDILVAILSKLKLSLVVAGSGALVYPTSTIDLDKEATVADAGEQATIYESWSSKQASSKVGCGWINVEGKGAMPYAIFPKEKTLVLYVLFGKYMAEGLFGDALAMSGETGWNYLQQPIESECDEAQSIIITASIIHHLVMKENPQPDMPIRDLITVDHADFPKACVQLAQSYAQELLKESMVHEQVIDSITASGTLLRHSS